MAKRAPLTNAQIDRCNDLADAIAALLGVPGEAVMTERATRISLTLDQAEQLIKLALNRELTGQLRQRLQSAKQTQALLGRLSVVNSSGWQSIVREEAMAWLRTEIASTELLLDQLEDKIGR